MLQTQFSIQANDFADSFRATVGQVRVGPFAYTPDMTAPEGPSTGGGVQALQHVRLLPPKPNMPTLVVGHVNQREMAAELRTFDHVDAICRERFKQGAPFDSAQYEQLLQSMQGFLGACGLRVAFAAAPEGLARRAAGLGSVAPPKSNVALIAAAAGALILIGLLFLTVVWFMRKG
jgi:hypothetical protein